MFFQEKNSVKFWMKMYPGLLRGNNTNPPYLRVLMAKTIWEALGLRDAESHISQVQLISVMLNDSRLD